LKAFQYRGLGMSVHALYIPPRGIRRKQR
jgi:hypothetical protein